jgi:aryl-alcohol dehydrogenase-like predicted oxidoreductase
VTHSQESANERLVALVEREKLDFVQLNYSLGERGAEARLLPAAAAAGTAVLVNLPFGRGRLFGAVRGRALPEWAAEFDAASWGQFFLKYLLANEAVSCVIPGMDKAEYVADNRGAARGRLPDAAQRRKMVELWESLR